MSMRLAVCVSMYIYTYEKVSLYRASEHKIYVYASSFVCVSMYIYTYEKVSLHWASEHKIYVYASSYVCVYVYLCLWKGKFAPSKRP